MKIDSALSTYVGHAVGYFTDAALVEWAVTYWLGNEHFASDPDLVELGSISTKIPSEVEMAAGCLARFVSKHWPRFDLKSGEAEAYAKQYFRARLLEYLAGQCTPYEVCRMITPIEQIYDFPGWLGNMYNACDWIEPDTRPADCKHLGPEIEKTLGL